MSRISGGVRGDRSDSELPDEILSVIPTDPFEQLDLAKKITSMAIASRVSNLEAEAIELRQTIQEREIDTQELEWKATRLESDFQESDSRPKIVLRENMNLKKERDSLAANVKNLICDMAKVKLMLTSKLERRANAIFGTENKDLYMSFQVLVPKNKT
ncbi:unnamed protein product [Arabis nemorensis]|uniref:Uncharacterized protein n=1 Tax=Arabis nemorensis TaxID=586526 RepID=A0A565B2M3_9BRAS|nr:unnamed protein product [Arabis nemorensis]